MARKAVGVNIKTGCLNSFADKITRLSVNKAKWPGYSSERALSFFRFLFEYLISGSKHIRPRKGRRTPGISDFQILAL